MTSLIEDGEESEELATLIALGFVPHLVMEANGEAYLDVFGERSTMAWEDGKIWYVEDGKEADGEEEEAAGGPQLLHHEAVQAAGRLHHGRRQDGGRLILPERRRYQVEFPGFHFLF